MKQIYKDAVDNIGLNETEKARIFYRVRNAEDAQPKRSVKRRVTAILTAALAVVLVFTITFNSMPVAATLAKADYPSAKTALTGSEDNAYIQALRAFAYETIGAVDRGADGNTVYSPYSMSITLAMLAEMTAGDTQKEILDRFGMSSVDTLSDEVKNLYGALYSEEGEFICRPVQSVWLDNSVDYKIDTLESIAEHQYATSFNLPIASGRADDAIADWMKEEMGTSDMPSSFLTVPNKLTVATGFTLRSEWQENFSKEQVYEGVFNGTDAKGDTVYMNKLGKLQFIQTNEAAAVKVSLAEGSSVVFILPDEDLGIDAMLEDAPLMQNLVEMTLAAEKQEVALAIPSTSFEEDLNIAAIMAKLGVSKVFDKYEADFSALSDDDELFASEILVRNVMDLREETAAEQGEEPYTAANMLTLDRPFAYIVVSEENVPLMIGVVENAMQMEE